MKASNRPGTGNGDRIYRGLHLQAFVEVEVDRIETALDAEGDN
jgi:hypothetical protein